MLDHIHDAVHRIMEVQSASSLSQGALAMSLLVPIMTICMVEQYLPHSPTALLRVLCLISSMSCSSW